MPLAGHGLRPTALRRRASRPQLKRDPLGSARKILSMLVPEKIVVRIKSNSAVPVADLIVHLRVQAGTKNPYFILFPKTNAHGTAELTRDDFVGQFKDHWESGLMDYNGSLESASPQVEAALFDPTWSIENRRLAMAWPLLAHERTKWSSRQEEYEYRVSSRNLAFSLTPTIVDLEGTPTIDLIVHPRDR